jgi:hypothetical protein
MKGTRTTLKKNGVFRPGRPEVMDRRILFRLQKVNQAVGIGAPLQCGFSGQYRILHAPQQIPFDRVDQNSVAEIQLRLHLGVLLLLGQGNTFIIPEVVDLMDSQWAEVDEELAAFDIEEADPVEFSPARRLVRCAVRFGSGRARDPVESGGGKIEVMAVLVIARHVSVP